MSRQLQAYWDEFLAGELVQDDHGQMLFTYSPEWLANPQAKPISQSLPLQYETFKQNQCRGFFGGLLPEEEQRELTAKNLGISKQNDFAMLAEIGGECAGAITFIQEGATPPASSYNYRNLSSEALAAIIRELPHRPLMAGEEGIRLSLAGAQNKVAIRFSDGEFSIPLGGAPSTHILKPASPHFADLVHNEALCMQLAKEIGLQVPEVIIGEVEDLKYLLVKRYDRAADPQTETGIRRLHQEDFCQALGITSERKYQKEGGPTLANCFDLVRRTSSIPAADLQMLLSAIIFNILIGNNDAHGKNFSLLYHGSPQQGISTRLAPLYDLICTDFYPTVSKTMAMKLGGESNSEKLYPKHFDQLAESAGLSKAGVKRQIPELAQLILLKLPDLSSNETTQAIATNITARCETMIARFRQGN